MNRDAVGLVNRHIDNTRGIYFYSQCILIITGLQLQNSFVDQNIFFRSDADVYILLTSEATLLW